MAFLSAEAANQGGIFNSQNSIVQQQLVAIRRSAHAVYCLDASKIGASAPFLLKKWRDVDYLLTDASEEKLAKTGIHDGTVSLVACHPDAPLPDIVSPNKSAFPIHFL